MSYHRIIPRDLFNEAKLLKCMGQIALMIHDGMDGGKLAIDHDSPEDGFIIDQNPNSGWLYVANLNVYRKSDGEMVGLATSYNSKSPYPLNYECGDDGGCVFEDDGTLTEEFRNAMGID